jgi:hypothetical protein
MSKKEARPSDSSKSTLMGNSSSSSQGKNNVTSAPSVNSGEAHPDDAYILYDIAVSPSSTATTTSNLSSSTPSSVQRHPTSVVSCSTIHPSALQSSYQRGSTSATTAADQIGADIQDVRNIIANYAVEPLEMLHLGKLSVRK